MDRETDAWITALISLRVITQAAKFIFFYIKLLTPAFPIEENELLSSLVISA